MQHNKIIICEFNRLVIECIIQIQNMSNILITNNDIISIKKFIDKYPDKIVQLFIKFITKHENNFETNNYEILNKINIKEIVLWLEIENKLSIINKYISFMKLFNNMNANNKINLCFYFNYLKKMASMYK